MSAPIEAKTQAKLVSDTTLANFKQRMADTIAQLQGLKAKVEREQQILGAQAAYKDAVRKGQEKAAKEQQAAQQKAQAQAQGQGKKAEALSDGLDTAQVNAQNPAASVGQGGPLDVSPGGGVGPFPSGPGVPGGDDLGLPGVGEAPPWLVSQRRTSEVAPREVGPGWTVPMRTRRTETDIRQNALRPGERVRALQENWRLQQMQRAAQQKELEKTIATEAEDLGSTLFSEKEDEISKGSTEVRFGELEAQYGRAMATRILIGARAHARGLELDRRKAQYQSDLIEGRTRRGETRRAAQRKAEKTGTEARPSALEKDKAAEIRLKILEGKQPTFDEQRFLDAYQKSKPLDVAIRNAFADIEAPQKKATQDDVDRVGEETGITDAVELRSRMEAMGYVFD